MLKSFETPIRAVCAAILAAPLLAMAAPQYIAHEIAGPDGQTLFALAMNDQGQIVGRTNANRKVDRGAAFFSSRRVFRETAIFGAELSLARAINNAGDIVGYYTPDTDEFEQRAYLQRRGQAPVDLFAAGEFWLSLPMAINREGMVVGAVEVSGLTDYRAFVWNDGVTTLLDSPFGGSYSTANAVSDKGVVVGTATDADGFEHAFRYANGQVTGLPSLVQKGPKDEARAVNSAGDVAGSCRLADFHRHACLWKEGGGIVDLGALPDAAWSKAFGLNDAGVAVGQSGSAADQDQVPHAVVFRQGRVDDLNAVTQLPAGVHLDIAFAVNEAGQIVAQGKDAQHKYRSYRLDPVTTR